MPAKGSVGRFGERDLIFSPRFFKNTLVKKLGVKSSYKECKLILDTANKIAADVIVEEDDGFKMPFGLGYLCCSKFKPEKPSMNWKVYKETGKPAYHLNLHTFGYTCRTFWFLIGKVRKAQLSDVYMFRSCSELQDRVSAAFSSGERVYNEWTHSDFKEKSRLENLYHKKYRKKEQIEEYGSN